MDITKIKAKKLKVVTKPSLKETMKSLERGVPTKFSNRDFKMNSIRNAASTLKQKGYSFQVTETGMVDCCIVTRIK